MSNISLKRVLSGTCFCDALLLPYHIRTYLDDWEENQRGGSSEYSRDYGAEY